MRFTVLFLLLSFSFASAQTFTVSENQRYILKDKQPFTWIGDTAWELFHALDREQAGHYLTTRAAQGFTVIQAVALAELDGLGTPNAYGEIPLINQDLCCPNEAYFKHVDFIIDKARDLGLTVALLPTWGDKLYKSSWGKGPEIFTKDNAYDYGYWIGNRYKDRTNIIWVTGGDRQPRAGSSDVEVWRALARGIEAGTGGPDNALITFHPQPNEEGGSEWFHNEDWFDFNMFQTGHCRDTKVYEKLYNAWQRLPHKPVLDGEPIYEAHPVCFNLAEHGLSTAYDIRKSVYLSVFAGGFGVTYGCHNVWQMYRPGREPVNGPGNFWYESLHLPAAEQMRHLGRLIGSRPMLERVPDQSLVKENDLPPADRIQATRDKNYAFIYSAAGKPFTVHPGKLSGRNLKAHWYDPRTGKMTYAGKMKNRYPHQFTPPGSGEDWVLVLDGK